MSNENNTITAPARLSVGDVIKINDDPTEYVVWFSGEKRTSAAPLNSKIECRVSEDGTPRFAADKGSMNVSAADKVEVIQSHGRTGLAELIAARKAGVKAAKPAKTEKPANAAKPAKAEKESKARVGRLGGYKGFSIASVVRALAADGWTYPEIRAWMDKEGIEASEQTIRLNIYRIKHNRGSIAELGSLPKKPKVEKVEKPAKAEKREKREFPGRPGKMEKADAKAEKPAKTEKPAKAAKPAKLRAAEQLKAMKKAA